MANEWLRSYLHNRLQYVSIGDNNSNLVKVICGVPQGSILDPRLFILYMMMIFIIFLLKLILFADDTIIFCLGKDPT